jgi:hypothetical protein
MTGFLAIFSHCAQDNFKGFFVTALFTSCFKAVASTGQLLQALATCRKDPVGDRGNDRRFSRLHPSRLRVETLNEVDLDL